MCKWPWDDLEYEYVTGDISYRELAKKHGIPFCTIADYAKNHSWKAKHDEHHDNAMAEALQNSITQDSVRLAELKDNVLQSAVLLSRMIMADLKVKHSMKPYEYGHYAGTLKMLYEFVPGEVDENALEGGLCFMPLQTDEDEKS